MRLIPGDVPEPAGPRSGELPSAADQPAQAQLPKRRRSEPNGAGMEPGPFAPMGAPDQPVDERRHRYLIDSPGPETTAVLDNLPTGPNGTGGNPPVDAESGNTEPLIIRAPLERRSDGPRPLVKDGDRMAPGPALPGGSGPDDLGLRPESVARLSASGRELLARLQAELQGGGTLFGPRPGGLRPSGGGNGTGPQGKVDPPDLAG